MTDYTELKRAAEAVLAMSYPWEHTVRDGRLGKTSTEYARLAHPSNVLALIAKNDSLRGSCRAMGSDMGKVTRERNAFRAKSEKLKAEIAGLQTDHKAYEQVNAELRAEVEALKAERNGKILCDLDLFENLRDAASTEAEEHRKCMATYRPLRQQHLDLVLKRCDDLLADIGNGEQSHG